MEAFFLVLNNTEKLEPILEEMMKQGFGGATILDSTGMLRVLDNDDDTDLPMLGVLRHFYNPERRNSKTMFTLIETEDRAKLLKIINEKTSGLDKPDTGIAFSVPVNFTEGVKLKHE